MPGSFDRNLLISVSLVLSTWTAHSPQNTFFLLTDVDGKALAASFLETELCGVRASAFHLNNSPVLVRELPSSPAPGVSQSGNPEFCFLWKINLQSSVWGKESTVLQVVQQSWVREGTWGLSTNPPYINSCLTLFLKTPETTNS